MAQKRSLLNVITALFFKLVLFVGSFLVRRYLIRFIGNDINGINSLYISIIGVLSVAELGIGDAIIFCMYSQSWLGIPPKYRRIIIYLSEYIESLVY